MTEEKILRPYLCYPLAELPVFTRDLAKEFYVAIAGHCVEVLGVRGFAPHERYDDPMADDHNFTAHEIDEDTRRRVRENTSVVIVVDLAPSCGVGIVVEMANQNNVPVILMCEAEKLVNQATNRLLRGNSAVKRTVGFVDKPDALKRLTSALYEVLPNNPIVRMKRPRL